MDSRRAGAIGAVLSLVSVLSMSGCGSEPAAPAAAPPKIGATLEQSRDNENRHLLQVAITPATTVTVLGLQLRGGGFVQVPATPRNDVVAAGTRTVFPFAYGTALCEGRPAPTVVLVDTPAGRLELPIDGDTLLPRLRTRECALGELARSAKLDLEALRRDGVTVHGELVVTRLAGSAPLQVQSTEGSVIFTVVPTGLPLTLAPTDSRATAPVTLTAARCDPHALTESKRSYSFPTYVTLSGGEPLYLLVMPDPAGVALLAALLKDACAAALHG